MFRIWYLSRGAEKANMQDFESGLRHFRSHWGDATFALQSLKRSAVTRETAHIHIIPALGWRGTGLQKNCRNSAHHLDGSTMVGRSVVSPS